MPWGIGILQAFLRLGNYQSCYYHKLASVIDEYVTSTLTSLVE